MTLLERLRRKREAALDRRPKDTVDLLWDVIQEELESFTGRELSAGSSISLEVDKEENRFWFTAFISNGELEEKFIRQFVLDIEQRENDEEVMEKIMRKADEEEIRAWQIEENTYGFEIDLAGKM